MQLTVQALTPLGIHSTCQHGLRCSTAGDETVEADSAPPHWHRESIPVPCLFESPLSPSPVPAGDLAALPRPRLPDPASSLPHPAPASVCEWRVRHFRVNPPFLAAPLRPHQRLARLVFGSMGSGGCAQTSARCRNDETCARNLAVQPAARMTFARGKPNILRRSRARPKYVRAGSRARGPTSECTRHSRCPLAPLLHAPLRRRSPRPSH